MTPDGTPYVITESAAHFECVTMRRAAPYTFRSKCTVNGRVWGVKRVGLRCGMRNAFWRLVASSDTTVGISRMRRELNNPMLCV